MTNYILSLLIASLAAAVVEMLVPRGDGGRMAAYVRMVAGLFLLVALISPLRAGLDLLASAADGSLSEDILAALPAGPADPSEHESTLAATLTATTAAEVEAWTRTELSSRFSIPPADATVAATCTYSPEDGRLTLIDLRIALTPAHLLTDPHPIEAYFADALACPCYVTIA